MVFHWSLSDSKSPQVSRTRLSILAVLSIAVVWIVSTRPPTSKSSRPFNNPLVTVPNAPSTIGTIVTFMFYSFCFYYYYYYCCRCFFCCCCCCCLCKGSTYSNKIFLSGKLIKSREERSKKTSGWDIAS